MPESSQIHANKIFARELRLFGSTMKEFSDVASVNISSESKAAEKCERTKFVCRMLAPELAVDPLLDLVPASKETKTRKNTRGWGCCH